MEVPEGILQTGVLFVGLDGLLTIKPAVPVQSRGAMLLLCMRDGLARIAVNGLAAPAATPFVGPVGIMVDRFLILCCGGFVVSIGFLLRYMGKRRFVSTTVMMLS